MLLLLIIKYINGKFNLGIMRLIKMFKKKYNQFNNSTNKSKLNQVLWFIENYLPQKKDQGV